MNAAAMTGNAESPDIRTAHYQGWDAIQIEHGPLSLMLVPQVGGRVMSVGWKDHELSFVNPELAGKVLDVAAVSDLRDAKRRFGFVLWGGDKTWLAPQDRWTDSVPFLDLDSGAYSASVDQSGSAVTMRSPVCRETGVQIERTVTMGRHPGAWSVTSRLVNASDHVVQWAPWDVDMMLRPATVFLPTRPYSAFPRGVRTFDAEGDSALARDQVVTFVGEYAVISCREAVKFKYGVDADVGRILAVFEHSAGGWLGYRKAVPTYHPQPYGHGCVLEIFNASAFSYIEMEVHGPVVSMQPGDSSAVTVDSALFELDEMPTSPDAIRTGLGIS